MYQLWPDVDPKSIPAYRPKPDIEHQFPRKVRFEAFDREVWPTACPDISLRIIRFMATILL